MQRMDFEEGSSGAFFNFGFQHLGQTLPQVFKPSAPGMQAKATGQASGSKEEAGTISGSIKRPYRTQHIPVMCPLPTLCFRCFPFLAASSREPALKWMIACDRRIKSINPALIKQGMMN